MPGCKLSSVRYIRREKKWLPELLDNFNLVIKGGFLRSVSKKGTKDIDLW